jgi:hypothetical protein
MTRDKPEPRLEVGQPGQLIIDEFDEKLDKF